MHRKTSFEAPEISPRCCESPKKENRYAMMADKAPLCDSCSKVLMFGDRQLDSRGALQFWRFAWRVAVLPAKLQFFAGTELQEKPRAVLAFRDL
jgi:hypothetical protein